MSGYQDLDVSGASGEQREEMLRLAADVRKFEIERLWQRSLVFWGFIGAAFVAYAELLEKEGRGALAVGCFGLICSLAWSFQNRGSKYWQEAWEKKVAVLECDVLGANLFSNTEPPDYAGFWGAARYSVTRLLTALSDFTVAIWVLLVAIAGNLDINASLDPTALAVVAGTLAYALFIALGTRSWPRGHKLSRWERFWSLRLKR